MSLRPFTRWASNSDLGKQLGGERLAARYWRSSPGRRRRATATTQTELYVVGDWRMRIETTRR